jgi:hypothetical protein
MVGNPTVDCPDPIASRVSDMELECLTVGVKDQGTGITRASPMSNDRMIGFG